MAEQRERKSPLLRHSPRPSVRVTARKGERSLVCPRKPEASKSDLQRRKKFRPVRVSSWVSSLFARKRLDTRENPRNQLPGPLYDSRKGSLPGTWPGHAVSPKLRHKTSNIPWPRAFRVYWSTHLLGGITRTAVQENPKVRLGLHTASRTVHSSSPEAVSVQYCRGWWMMMSMMSFPEMCLS